MLSHAGLRGEAFECKMTVLRWLERYFQLGKYNRAFLVGEVMV
jgi:hypothetical protein